MSRVNRVLFLNQIMCNHYQFRMVLTKSHFQKVNLELTATREHEDAPENKNELLSVKSTTCLGQGIQVLKIRQILSFRRHKMTHKSHCSHRPSFPGGKKKTQTKQVQKRNTSKTEKTKSQYRLSMDILDQIPA